MSSEVIRTVNDLKEALSKELKNEDSSSEKCVDILDQLDGIKDITLKVLTETLVGTIVSKFKSNSDADVAAKAKSLVKKWKQVAKQSGVGKPTDAGKKPQTKTKPAPTKATPPARQTSTASMSSTTSTSSEWDLLPPLRKNTANKLHTVLKMSSESLAKSGVHEDAVKSLGISRTSEIEEACHNISKGQKQAYLDKIRSLVFNLKKNADLREQVLLGAIQAENLVQLPPELLLTADKMKKRDDETKKLKDSRRLDWEEKNEGKINEMCGIKGDLLKASLFTCGRCKSIKTTSTQKQTRSADEPMTVFVLCLNCGNRWKC